MREACCRFHSSGIHTCEDLERCDCELIPGATPMGPGTTCEQMCPQGPDDCFRCGTQSCCRGTGIPGDDIAICDDSTVEDCINRLGFPAGLGSICDDFGEGNHTCSKDVSACCLPDGSCEQLPTQFSQCMGLGGAIISSGDFNLFCGSIDCYAKHGLRQACCMSSGACQDLSPNQCCAELGLPAGEGTNCSNTGHLCEEFDPPGCRYAQEDETPEDRLEWTADLCANVYFVPYIREPHEYPDPALDPDFEPGFVEFITVHPTRIIDIRVQDVNANVEPCHYHIGRLEQVNGFMRVGFCGQRTHGDATTKYRSWAGMVNADNEFIEGAAFLGSYEPPMWQEMQYHSAQIKCKGPEE